MSIFPDFLGHTVCYILFKKLGQKPYVLGKETKCIPKLNREGLCKRTSRILKDKLSLENSITERRVERCSGSSTSYEALINTMKREWLQVFSKLNQ